MSAYDSAMRSLGALTLAFLGACLDPTQVMLDLRAVGEVGCTSEADFRVGRLVIYAGRADEPLFDQGESASVDASECKGGALGTLALTPSGEVEGPRRVVSILGTLEGGLSEVQRCATQIANVGTSKACKLPSEAEPGETNLCEPCIVASRTVSFIDHTKLELSIDFTAQCRGVFCDEGKTCASDGKCKDDRVSCEADRCTLPGDGGGGGTGGGGGAGAGGAGGAGAGGAGGWTLVSQDEALDVWATEAENPDVYFVSQNGFFQCVDDVCTRVHQGAFGRVHGKGASVVATAMNGYQLLSGAFVAPPACAPAQSNVVDVHLDTAVRLLVAAPGESTVVTNNTCGNSVPVSDATRLWPTHYPAGYAYLSAGSLVGPMGSMGLPFAVSDLWGVEDAAGANDKIYLCGSGISVATLSLSSASVSTIEVQPCRAIWGRANEGVWIVEPLPDGVSSLVRGYALSMTGDINVSDVVDTVVPTGTPRGLWVGPTKIYVASLDGLFALDHRPTP